jgi:hypothetical protein
MRCDLPQRWKNLVCIISYCNGEIVMQESLSTVVAGFDVWSITNWNGRNGV